MEKRRPTPSLTPELSIIEEYALPRKAFLLRIDKKLWQDLEKWAQDELRSVNGQIEFLLKMAVEKRRGVEEEEKLEEENYHREHRGSQRKKKN